MRRTLELTAEVFGHPPVPVRAKVEDLDRPARVRRALRIALPLLAGALLTLPIPAVHLATVPGFLIAAIWFGVRRLRQHRIVEEVAGSCPACRDEVRYAVPDTTRFPDTYPCPSCQEFVKLAEAS